MHVHAELSTMHPFRLANQNYIYLNYYSFWTDPNDVLDPAELNEPPPPRDPKPIPTLRPPSLPSVPPPKFLLPVEQPEPIQVFPESEQLRPRRRRRAAISLGKWKTSQQCGLWAQKDDTLSDTP